jgi:hypothetical protein
LARGPLAIPVSAPDPYITGMSCAHRGKPQPWLPVVLVAAGVLAVLALSIWLLVAATLTALAGAIWIATMVALIALLRRGERGSWLLIGVGSALAATSALISASAHRRASPHPPHGLVAAVPYIRFSGLVCLAVAVILELRAAYRWWENREPEAGQPGA